LKERDRQRETDRERDRERERDIDRDRERQRKKERQKDKKDKIIFFQINKDSKKQHPSLSEYFGPYPGKFFLLLPCLSLLEYTL
jgi:hypothetical protein